MPTTHGERNEKSANESKVNDLIKKVADLTRRVEKLESEKRSGRPIN